MIVAAATGYERLRGGAGPDSALWRRFRRERVETVELLAAGGDPGAQRWLNHVRHRKLSISGDDLVAAGLTGAAVGEGLARATRGDAGRHRAGPREPAARRRTL